MTRFSKFLPCYDAVTETGGGGAVADPVDLDTGGDDSLAEHEASFGGAARRATAEPDASETETPAETRERDKDGKFIKPRHRARSQQATPEDVPRIQELTRKHREAEERASAAERRAEEAERRAAERRETRAEPEPAPKPAPKATFPTYEEFIAVKGNESADWYAYQDARTGWYYEQRREAERAEEAKSAAERAERELADTYRAEVEKIKAELPDFDAALAKIGPRDVSLVVRNAAMQVGPRAAYYLATHLEELRELTADTLMSADTPGFDAAVKATKRYLARLVAPEQRSSPTRTAAGTTGAARATTPSLAPKPPTLVRTGASRDSEDLPGDDASLADHEKAFGRRRA